MRSVNRWLTIVLAMSATGATTIDIACLSEAFVDHPKCKKLRRRDRCNSHAIHLKGRRS